MITPAEIRQKAERLYLPFLRAWLRGETFFPQDFSAGKLPKEYLELSAAVERLLKESKQRRSFGYTVELTTQHTQRYGTQSLPTRIVIETERDLLKLLGKEAEFAAFQQDAALIRAQLPQLADWSAEQPQRVIEYHGAWPELLRVCAYFLAHPRPQLYLRELPINVHTKFIETHTGILRRLLDALLPSTAIDAAESAFEKRFGLRYEQPLIRLRLLDDRLRDLCGSALSDVSTPLSEFATLKLRGYRCVITENKLTFLTLPPLPQTFAIFGGGFNVELLKTVGWLADCALVYWGDLDAQGFQILSTLRAAFPTVVSLMMDDATFQAFQSFVVPGKPCAARQLPHLTAAEHALFLHLVETQARLEQEHISHLYALSRLAALEQFNGRGCCSA